MYELLQRFTWTLLWNSLLGSRKKIWWQDRNISAIENNSKTTTNQLKWNLYALLSWFMNEYAFYHVPKKNIYCNRLSEMNLNTHKVIKFKKYTPNTICKYKMKQTNFECVRKEKGNCILQFIFSSISAAAPLASMKINFFA